MSSAVCILMGSPNDWQLMREAAGELERLGVRWEAHVASAHRTPERTTRLVRESEQRGVEIFICGAGMAAHLAGVVAAHTIRPVLGVPLPGGLVDGLDALLATVQMPAGIPVATVAVGKAGARNAAVLAAEILALHDAGLAERLRAVRASQAEAVERADSTLALSPGEAK
jgi:5-(carboxyamino)imidazole ribonucleotide mutase